MSASERLQELLLHKPGNHWDAEVNAVLRKALPGFLAVVQAAELLRHEAITIHTPEYPSTLKSNYAAAKALAVLEDALQ